MWQSTSLPVQYQPAAVEVVQRPQAREPIYTPRRKQACSRCHTKRIKCLGGVPCRNCTLSNSSCTFPPPRPSRNSASQQAPVSPIHAPKEDQSISSTTDRTITLPSSRSWNYRRSEKDFNSSRSSHSNQALRQTYRGSPSCRTFTEQFMAWTAVQRLQLNPFNDTSFDPAWAALGQSDYGSMNTGLEISIDTTVSHSSARPEATKPVKIRLPPYNYSMHLIQCVESAIGHEQHYFRRQQLRTKLSQMYQNPEATQSKDQGWLCHWLAILALGELYGTNRQVGLADGQETDRPPSHIDDEPPGAQYYHQSMAFLQQVAENPNVQYIETLSLLVIYAFSLDKINTAFMYSGLSMRAALSLGLHRSPQDFPSERSNLPEAELEHQKRVFWTVYYQDLLTTTTTGRPWGILDDEITIDYADSSRLGSESLMEFFDPEESNAHLEIMRLRGQAYSSLYGYAGTAINPYSHISLFDFDLGGCLSQQHLDKMFEFHQGLLTWHRDLPVQLQLARSWDGSLLNLNRVTASLHLIYHQTILVLLRPALVNVHNDWFEAQTKQPATTVEIFPTGSKSMLQAFRHTSLESARETATILQWLQHQGALAIYSYFDASYAFTAAITLHLARLTTQSVHTHTGPYNTGLTFSDEDQTALNTCLLILSQQRLAGNVPAREFERQLRVLENNLQALQAALTNRVVLDDLVFDDLEGIDLTTFPQICW
ncbi:fungal-specific transcription factor domain-containing protein [Exophiala viscosa]|uniref:Fungal-specific transcription factor domain-containing protein n=1 Tax=Exophiala viscosa TaxID=2486360 RepID=A0AAN6DV47_9EURO|nr:fungal-specific transcription factor domain-containing protein [Exophiala viscosa]